MTIWGYIKYPHHLPGKVRMLKEEEHRKAVCGRTACPV
jgi:hypothetical protein